MNERDLRYAETDIRRFRTRFELLTNADQTTEGSYGPEGHYVFALHASFPLYFTPDLLYRLWQNFNSYSWQNSVRLIHPMAVSDVLLSPLCREIGHEQFELVPAVRNLLSRELMAFSDPEGRVVFGEQRRIELAEFLNVYAKKHYIHPADENWLTSHVWTARSVLDPAGSARDIVNALSKSMVRNDTEEMLRLVLLADSFDSEAFQEIKSLGQVVKESLFGRETEKKVTLRYAADDSGNATILLPPSIAKRVASAPVEVPPPPEMPEEATKAVESLKVYIAYNRSNTEYFDHLTVQLSTLILQGEIELSSTPYLENTTSQAEEIKKSIEQADLILWLLSVDYYIDDLAFDQEYNIFLERWNASTVAVIPILIKPCDLSWSILSQVQTLPSGPIRYISEWSDPMMAWQNIEAGIRKWINSKRASPPKIDDTDKINAFVISSGKDFPYRDALIRHFEGKGKYKIWHSDMIGAGEQWEAEIQKNLYKARIIILLLSPDFFNSEYIREIELRATLERASKENTRIVPIIIRPCFWYRHAALAAIPAYPANFRAVSLWESKNEAWSDVYDLLELSEESFTPRTANQRIEFHAYLEPKKKQDVVILSASENHSFHQELITMLRPFEELSIWQGVLPGESWGEVTRKQLDSADLIFVLIDSYAWHSPGVPWDMIEQELYKKNKRIIPVLIQPCFWYVHPVFKSTPIYPSNLRPISMWTNRDEAWEKLLTTCFFNESVLAPIVHLPYDMGRNMQSKPSEVVIWGYEEDDLKRHLIPLEQTSIIKTHVVFIGDRYKGILDLIESKAEVVVILINDAFLSDWNKDTLDTHIIVQMLLERNGKDLAVLPILVEDCDWKAHPIAKLMLLIDTEKPLSAWYNSEYAWSDVVGQLFELLLALKGKEEKSH